MMSFSTKLLVAICLAASVNGWWAKKKKVEGRTIASIADKYEGSKKWAKATFLNSIFSAGSNKCNAFVASVLEEAGAEVPQRHWYYSPIGAWEWGNPNSPYLSNNKCYKRVSAPGQLGDVIAGQGHVGIVTGNRMTTSAAEYQVVKNDWGYRSINRNIVFWRYVC